MAVKVTVYGTANMRQIEGARRELDRLEQTARTAGSGFSSSMTKVSNSLKEAGGKVTDTGKTLTTRLTLPLLAIGAAGVMIAADFDTTMASLQVNAQASGATMERLRDLAIQMGQDTVFSAGEAASAMLELSKGGLKPAAIEAGALKSAMNLAATEGMDLADASTIVVQAMNTFGIKAKNTGKVVDLLAAGAVASTAGVAELAAGMKYVGSTAATLHMPMRDVVTSLAALNNAGLDSSTAGTSLNRMLLGIAAPTDKAAAMMDKLGLKLTNAKGQMLPMQQIVKQLRDKVSDLGDADRQAALKRMFGVEGMRAANILINEGAKGYKKLSTEVTKQGVAQELSNARMSGMAGALEQMKGSLETAALRIGSALQPVIEAVSGFIKDLADRFASLSPATQKVIVVVGLIVAAMGPLLIIIGSLITAAGVIAGAIAGISLPIIAVVAGIALLVAGIVYAWNTSESFRNAVMGVWNAIKSAVTDAVNGIKAKLAENADKIEAFKAGLSKVWEFLQTYVIPAIAKFYEVYLSTLIRVIGFVIEKVIDFYSAMWDVATWFIDFFGPTFKKGIDTIAKVFEYLVGVAQRVWTLVTAAIRTAVDWIVNNLWPKIKPIVDLVVKGWERIYPAVKSAWDKVLAFLGGLVSTFATIGGQLIDGIKAGFGRAWDSFVGWAKEQVDKLPEAVKVVFGIASPSRVFAEIGGNLVAGLKQGMGNKVPELLEAGRALGSALSSTLTEGGKDLQKNLGETYVKWFDDTVEKLKSKVADAKQAMKDFATSTAQAITGSMSFGDAQSGATDRSKAIADAQKALADAQAKASQPDATDSDRAAVGVAQQSLVDAQNQGTQLGLTFIQALQLQAEKAAEFAARVKTLIAMGLSQAALQQVLQAGVQAGTEIANQLIGGGANLISTTNELVKSSQAAADKVGLKAAESYYGTGVKTAQDTLAGFKDQFSKGGPGYKKLMGVMDNLADDAKRTTRIDVEVTRNITEVVTRIDGARAGGGYVSAGGTYLVGELGPELFVPSTSGSIVPNNRLGGGGGRQITIEKGAVQVTVQGATGDIAGAVTGAIDDALTRLAQELVSA